MLLLFLFFFFFFVFLAHIELKQIKKDTYQLMNTCHLLDLTCDFSCTGLRQNIGLPSAVCVCVCVFSMETIKRVTT